MHYGLPILSTFFPRRLPYQHVYFLHQMLVSLSVCLTQLGPVLFPKHDLEAMNDKEVIQAVGEIAQRGAEMSRLTERVGKGASVVVIHWAYHLCPLFSF